MILDEAKDLLKKNGYIFYITCSLLKIENEDKSIKCFCVGNLTERSLRLKGFNNTVAASGTVNALKNLIINSENKAKRLAYLCGDIISFELDTELYKSGF